MIGYRTAQDFFAAAWKAAATAFTMESRTMLSAHQRVNISRY